MKPTLFSSDTLPTAGIWQTLAEPLHSLPSLLSAVDDLLFVLDMNGRVVTCKARVGSDLTYFPMEESGFAIQAIFPSRVSQKFEQAVHQVMTGSRFVLFETMLIIPGKGAAWYEFRLIPALNRQLVLFVWNVNSYHKLSRTVVNVPFAVDKMIKGWSRALYLRDFETEDHTRRVAAMTLKLARQLGIPEWEMLHIRRGAQLHDIGKIAIPDHILLKAGALTDEEWGVMRQHPLIALELLRPISQVEAALAIPRSHHEKWDGSGYPDNLAGDDIPLAARIFAFVDVFDALTSDRPYRRAWSHGQALEYIRSQSGAHFDPSITSMFIRMFSTQ